MNVILRTTGPADNVAASLRQLFRDENVLGGDLQTLRVHVRERLTRERLLSWLSGFFGVLAALLAAVGLYGVMSVLGGAPVQRDCHPHGAWRGQRRRPAADARPGRASAGRRTRDRLRAGARHRPHSRDAALRPRFRNLMTADAGSGRMGFTICRATCRVPTWESSRWPRPTCPPLAPRECRPSTACAPIDGRRQPRLRRRRHQRARSSRALSTCRSLRGRG